MKEFSLLALYQNLLELWRKVPAESGTAKNMTLHSTEGSSTFGIHEGLPDT
jgi:hypothetical protein